MLTKKEILNSNTKVKPKMIMYLSAKEIYESNLKEISKENSKKIQKDFAEYNQAKKEFITESLKIVLANCTKDQANYILDLVSVMKKGSLTSEAEKKLIDILLKWEYFYI